MLICFVTYGINRFGRGGLVVIIQGPNNLVQRTESVDDVSSLKDPVHVALFGH